MDSIRTDNCGKTKKEAKVIIDKVLESVRQGRNFTIQEYDDNDGEASIVYVTISGEANDDVIEISTRIEKV